MIFRPADYEDTVTDIVGDNLSWRDAAWLHAVEAARLRRARLFPGGRECLALEAEQLHFQPLK